MLSFDLDSVIVDFKNKGISNPYTIRNAVEGIQIFGGIGSGKSSGSGRRFALQFLKNGFGGIVLTVKPDEKEVWLEYCKSAGRSSDLIVIEEGGHHKFDFIDYESSKSSNSISPSTNLVQVLKTVIRSSEEKSSGKSDDPFWESALDVLMSNVIDLCYLAYGRVSVELIYDIVQAIPKKEDVQSKIKEGDKNAFIKAFNAAAKKVDALTDKWQLGYSDELKEEWANAGIFNQRLADAVPESRLLRFITQFFFENYIMLSDKTRSIIDFSFSSFLFRLLREPFYSQFCSGNTTIKPEDCLEGKIILVNFPVKSYYKSGQEVQIAFKYVWQRAMENRDIKKNNRPLFLWADEAQNFIHEYDADYQATARSSMISTVYITQNLPNYYANMGGSKSDPKVKSFLGTLATKIFHANADIETNKYASELIGEEFATDTTTSSTMSDENVSSTVTKMSKLMKVVRPERFQTLKTGGKVNEYITQAYVLIQGRPFIIRIEGGETSQQPETGEPLSTIVERNFLLVPFSQVNQ